MPSGALFQIQPTLGGKPAHSNTSEDTWGILMASSTPLAVITLTTDFGISDWFVGTMKGVIASLAPEARVIDLGHGIAPGDVWSGAFMLSAAAPFFPQGTIHVAVVDPGVGSERAAIVIQTDTETFVGPDNGLLSLAVRNREIRAAHSLTNPACFLPSVSRTFQGRDLFAPVAARLAQGMPMGEFGPPITQWISLPWSEPRVFADHVEGEVIHVDHYGNALTNITDHQLRARPQLRTVHVAGVDIPIRATYAAVRPGDPVAVLSSSQYLEVAINHGSAAREFGLSRGSRVSLRNSLP